MHDLMCPAWQSVASIVRAVLARQSIKYLLHQIPGDRGPKPTIVGRERGSVFLN